MLRETIGDLARGALREHPPGPQTPLLCVHSLALLALLEQYPRADAVAAVSIERQRMLGGVAVDLVVRRGRRFRLFSMFVTSISTKSSACGDGDVKCPR